MPTFVHTADVHFDTPFSARFTPRQASLRRKEVMQTFQKIADRAAEADLFLISGDLFDGRYVSADTAAYLKRCFSSMPGTQVLIAAGNHDPLTAESPYRTEEWSENVHIFGTEMEFVDFPQWQIRVHGRSFGQRHEKQPLLSQLELAPDWTNVLVLHGELVAEGGNSIYNPIERPVLEQSGADYAALGHVHQYSGLKRLGRTGFAYPGIPEGRGFDEEGRKGYLMGELQPGAVRAEWIPVSRRSFWHVDADLTGMEDSMQVLEAAERALAQAGGAEDLYKLSLTGRARRGLAQPEFLTEQLRDRAFYLEVLDKTVPDYSLEELAEEPSLRGAFVSEMLERIAAMSETEKEIGLRAIRIGLEAMEGGQNG